MIPSYASSTVTYSPPKSPDEIRLPSMQFLVVLSQQERRMICIDPGRRWFPVTRLFPGGKQLRPRPSPH